MRSLGNGFLIDTWGQLLYKYIIDFFEGFFKVKIVFTAFISNLFIWFKFRFLKNSIR